MTKLRAILLLLILGVAAFLFIQLYPGRKIPRHFNGPPIVSSQPLRSEAIEVRFSPDSKYLLVAGSVGKGSLGRYQEGPYLLDYRERDTRLRLFNVANEHEVERLKVKTAKGEWLTMLISPDCKKLISTSHFWPLLVVDIRGSSPGREIDVTTLDRQWHETVTSIKLSPDGKVLALGTISGVQFYDARYYRFLRGYEHPGGKGTEVTFGRNSNVVKIGFLGSRRPHFVSVKTAKRIPAPRSTREFDVTFSPDGKYFADITSKTRVTIWQHDAKQSFKIGTIRSALVEVRAVEFSPDNRTVVVGGWSSTETPIQFYKLSDIRTANKTL